MKEQKKTTVEIKVFDYKRKVLPNARVNLKQLGGKAPKTINLNYDKQRGVYQAVGILPGSYLLQAKFTGLEPDEREIRVDPCSRLRDVFYLGKKGMPFYYRGKVKVPFEPPKELLGVSVRPAIRRKEEEDFLAYARELKLQPVEVSGTIRENNVRIFRFPTRSSEKSKNSIQQRLSEHQLVRLVGPVIRMDKESVSFLTRQLIVKFKPEITEEKAFSFIKNMKLNVMRSIPYSSNAYLLQSDGQASFTLLKICDEIIKSGLVLYADPNLVTTIADDQVNPGDYLVPEQWHIDTINLPGAWQTLRNANPPGVVLGGPGDISFGSEDVVIAVIDRGISSQTVGGVTSTTHPDFDGTVTSGSDKVYRFFDFDNMVPNNNNIPVRGDGTLNNHGAGCAGVATILADNPSAIAGTMEGTVSAAPNCRLMSLIRPPATTELDYADMYIWTAGFDPHSSTPGFPAAISPGADIITNSYGAGNGAAAIPEIIKDAFNYLTTYGRDGKGCLLFFSAGNGDDDLSVVKRWAIHEKVMAVGASTNAEVRADYSNFGDDLDFCAPSSNGLGIVTADLIDNGNLPGHPAAQTTLTQAVAPAPVTTLTANVGQGDTTLNVASNNGFVVNQWILLGYRGRSEFVQITGIPAGNTQLTVTPLMTADLIPGVNFWTNLTVTGVTTLNVANSAGFAANQWLMLELPGQAGMEPALIQNVPAGGNQIMVAGPANNHPINTPVIFGPNNYTPDFGGTSSATPLAAGVAALVLSVNPELTWVQVRQILRDTAVHIDAGNAQWVDLDADGVVDFNPLYGYGRIDAQAAVQMAEALVGVNSVNHIDTWIMENSSDVGDVPSLPPYSPDVWVRNQDPAVDNPALVNQHQSPIRGQDNWVYANVRNRGVIDSHDVYVRIFITRWAGTQYVYPDDFIPTVPPSSNPVTPLAPGTYLIGEVHVDTVPAGGSVTVNTIWPADLIPAASVVIDGVVYSWADSCLLVDVSPHDGPIPTGANTWDNNNLCQRNTSIVDPGDDDDLAMAFVVGHKTNDTDLLNLRIERNNLPAKVKLAFDYVDHGVAKEVLGLLDEFKEKRHLFDTCDLTVITEAKGQVHCPKTGRISPVVIAPNTRISLSCCHALGEPIKYRLNPVAEGKRTVFGLPTLQRVFVPVPRKPGGYQVLALMAKGLRDLKKGEYQIDIYQETRARVVKGGVNFIIRKK